jgi:flavorubredoxin
LRIITTYLGVGKMSLFAPLPMERVYLLNPGQSINMGDRELTAIKPPSYDAPETTGFYDPKTATFFCSDCFGALMSEPVDNAAGMGAENLRKAMVFWATVDAPWLHTVDRILFARNLDQIRKLSPKLICSAHLPIAQDMIEELLENLRAAPEAQPFVGPDQQAIEAMFAEMTGAQP